MKLFHCVVVMGAAIGNNACGGEATTDPGAPRDAGGSNDATASATTGQESGIILSNCTAATACFFSTCSGPAAAPHSSQDCPRAQQFRCDGAACGCDPSAPLTPTDCPATAQFSCGASNPPCGCYCNLEAGIDPAACCGDAAGA
ncbi:MAG: hypothetical protein M3O46_22025, partial [Myxococcota bacterium]|nr:hypothetical protein [Myxococcota bacterium]